MKQNVRVTYVICLVIKINRYTAKIPFIQKQRKNKHSPVCKRNSSAPTLHNLHLTVQAKTANSALRFIVTTGMKKTQRGKFSF